MADNNILADLYKLILDRKENKIGESEDKSYTRYLFKEGLNKILKKVGEESSETIIAAKEAERDKNAKIQVIGEVSDLLYHLLVMLADLDISLDEVESELKSRSEKMGNLKDLKTVDKNT